MEDRASGHDGGAARTAIAVFVVLAMVLPSGLALAHHRPDHAGGPPSSEPTEEPTETPTPEPTETADPDPALDLVGSAVDAALDCVTGDDAGPCTTARNTVDDCLSGEGLCPDPPPDPDITPSYTAMCLYDYVSRLYVLRGSLPGYCL